MRLHTFRSCTSPYSTSSVRWSRARWGCDLPRGQACVRHGWGEGDRAGDSVGGGRAAVRGGGGGVGRATVLMLAQAGASVAVGYRSRRAEADETLAAVRRLRRVAIGIAGDLGDSAAAGRAVDEAVQGLGGLELLIVNHGIWPPDDVPVAAMADAQWDATLRGNLSSVLYVCQAANPLLPAVRRIGL